MLLKPLPDTPHCVAPPGWGDKMKLRAMNPSGQTLAEPNPAHLSAIRRHFEISLYFLILTGVLTLVSTGKLDLLTILVLPSAMLFKGYRWWHGKGPEFSSRVANWLTVIYFVFFPVDLWVISRILAVGAQNPSLYAALLATVHLMLFATVVRLYSATTIRDYLFLTMMGFTSMLAAAILTVDTVFLAFFFIFLGLAVSTFVALEMWRSAQGTVTRPMEIGTGVADQLHGALGVTSIGIALGALLVGGVIFLILPRFSGGYMSALNMQSTMITGFSDDVELGEIGEIKKNSMVVMRVTVDGGVAATRGLRWRGVVLSKFDGKRWYNDPHEPTTLAAPAEGGWFHVNPVQGLAHNTGNPVHYTVLLEPIGSTALFFANEVETLRGRFGDDTSGRPSFGQHRTYLLKDFTGSIFNPYHSYTRMEYEANSLVPSPPPAAVRDAGTDYPTAIRDTYLQLPKLDSRIPALAQQIAERAATPYDKARAIEEYLRTHFGYTLDLSGTPQGDPLAYFLFQKRAGHCEYFAAAMTVMLRTQGIPARYINGFQTGEYNDVAGDLVVRASDAHSWVEAYFPGFGWLTFDPTPPSTEKPPGFFAQIFHYLDWFELQWSEWVINYDFLHQVTVAQNVGRFSRDWAERIRNDFSSMRRSATDRMKLWQERIARSPADRTAILFLFGIFVVGVLILRPEVRRRLRVVWRTKILPARIMTSHLATLQYMEMLHVLARGGIHKTAAQTPMEFAASLPDGTLAAPVIELTSIYQAARYGGKPADPKHASSLIERIRTFLRSGRK